MHELAEVCTGNDGGWSGGVLVDSPVLGVVVSGASRPADRSSRPGRGGMGEVLD